MSVSLFLMPSLGLFFCCWLCLILICSVFYLILSYFIFIYYLLEVCFFPNEKQKRVDLDRRKNGETLGEVGGEIIIRIYFVGKKIYFQFVK